MDCRSRGSGFRGVATAPASSITDIRSFFDRCAATGCPEQHGHPQRLLDYRLSILRDLARRRRSDVVLDIGCGHGHHLPALAPDVARGIGIDVSPRMIDLARARLHGAPQRADLTFEVDNAEELKGIADRSIDLAICIGAFEHILDKRVLLASTYRVLKPGGRFFCLSPHAGYVWYRSIAPMLGYATRHLPSDRLLARAEFSALLIEPGFGASGPSPGRSFPGVTCRPSLRSSSPDSMRSGGTCAWIHCGAASCSAPGRSRNPLRKREDP